MMQSLKNWQRFESEGLPIYVNGSLPDWFVADERTDLLLRGIMNEVPRAACGLEKERLFSLLEGPGQAPPPYLGRGRYLQLASLRECWFHLTDRCNLACRHCLFSASPARSRSLGRQQLEKAISEAKALGCRLFYFTGGEPFIYPEFPQLMLDLLQDQAVRAVVLTNGLLLSENLDFLQQVPADRFHLQLSLDGMEQSHDRLRGQGTFAGLCAALALLRQTRINAVLSIAVNRENLHDLSAMVRFAAEQGVRHLHLLWHFVRGKGNGAQFVAPAAIWPQLATALETAAQCGVIIDNLEVMKSQVFATPGTRFDLSNSGWESLTVGPDGAVYPSPALVGVEQLRCGDLREGLEYVWRESAVLQEVRSSTLAGSAYEANSLRFLVGGGDLDHSYVASGSFSGHDPYVELYNRLALWLIARQAASYPKRGGGGAFLLKMGDVRHDCPDTDQEVGLTHCNCVVSFTGADGHRTVREFYALAATRANRDIVNPFAPRQAEARFIPLASRQRSYGCGSPVQEATLQPGETLVDLGSGSGVECFQAAEMVGPAGRVYGIDMTEEMLTLARSSQSEVARALGYDNVRFCKGLLEAIPLADQQADAVISNCVINLSVDKRRTLHEAFRILKPGGRLVVADIVTDDHLPARMKNNARLRGECLGGAMRQEELLAMLRAAGFGAVRLLKRFPYRQEMGVSFYSLTFRAEKPAGREAAEVIYRGPFAAVYSEAGELLLTGRKTRIALDSALVRDEAVFAVDGQGAVVNMIQSGGGCCGSQPESSVAPLASPGPLRQDGDCLVCGSELRYFTDAREKGCYYCGERKSANACCQQGHFVCDSCHQHQGVAVIRKLCTESAIEDMVTLMKKIRRQPAIAMHGPEHHALVPGVILSTYRARGGRVGKKEILAAIERGSKVPGGVCGFWGCCGAALGVGIAFSVILEATPLTAGQRQTAQQVTAGVLARIAALTSSRCCQRETMIALQEAACRSAEILPVALLATDTVHCAQYQRNRECAGSQCPLWAAREQDAADGSLALVI